MAQIRQIVSADDPRIEPFRDVRERDLVGRGGFIAEGTVVLDQLLASTSFRPTALLVLRQRLEGLLPRLSSLESDCPVYVAERDVFDRIAGFPVHRGVLAHAERTSGAVQLDLAAIAARGGLVVGAIGIGNHDNLGALFRNAKAFGASAVVLDDTACDPLYRKAIRVSVGTTLTVPFQRLGTEGQVAATLAEAGFSCVALSPKAERNLAAWRPQGATALLVGAEGPGLGEAVRASVEGLRVEMAPGLDSLNLATAAAIALHHVFVWREAGHPAPR